MNCECSVCVLTKMAERQFVLDALCSKNTLVLQGHEDQLYRQRWANLLKAKVKFWDFELMGPEALFSTCLEGKAFAEFEALGKREGESNKDFGLRVIEHFASVPALGADESCDLMARFKNVRLQPGESLDEGFSRLKGEVARIHWQDAKAKDDILRYAYSRLLPPNVREILKLKDNLNAAEYFAASKKFAFSQDPAVDHALPQAAAAFERSVQDRMSAQQSSIETLAECMKSLQASFDGLKQNPQQPAAPPKNNNRRGKNKSVNAMQQRQGDQRPFCKVCNKTGHATDNCWSLNGGPPNRPKLQPPPAPEVVCQLCGGTGHVALQCNAKRSVVCYGCNQTGHLQRDCMVAPRQGNQQRPYNRRWNNGRQQLVPYQQQLMPYQQQQVQYQPQVFPQQQMWPVQPQSQQQAPRPYLALPPPPSRSEN